jgi:hypothetical protein
MTELISFEIQISFTSKGVYDETSDKKLVSEIELGMRIDHSPPDHFLQCQFIAVKSDILVSVGRPSVKCLHTRCKTKTDTSPYPSTTTPVSCPRQAPDHGSHNMQYFSLHATRSSAYEQYSQYPIGGLIVLEQLDPHVSGMAIKSR